MALQDTIAIYHLLSPVYSTNLVNSFTLADANDKGTFIFTVPKTGTLKQVHFYANVVTTGDTIRVSFQDLNASGFPDGVVDEYRTVPILSTQDTTWFQSGILSSDGSDSGIKRSVTIGTRLALVLDYATYTSGNMSISYSAVNMANTDGVVQAGRSLYNTTGTWVATNIDTCLMLALEYSDGTTAWMDGFFPGRNDNTLNFNSTSTPNEFGVKFWLPFRALCCGLVFSTTAGTGPGNGVLYSSDGSTQLASGLLNPPPAYAQIVTKSVVFTTSVILEAGSLYYLSLRPTTAATLNTVQRSFPNNICKTASGLTNFIGVSRNNPGSWTETPLVIHAISPSIAQLSDDISASTTVNPVEVTNTFVQAPFHSIGY